MQDLLDRARAETGLQDFGDDAFLEGLGIPTAALRSEARLNARGEAYIYSRIVGHLSQRLPGRGLGTPASGDRRRAGDRAAVRAGPAAHRVDGAEFPARAGSRHPVPCAAGKSPPVPTAVHRRGRRPRIPREVPKVLAGSRTHVPVDTNGPMECLDLMALVSESQSSRRSRRSLTYSRWLVDRADFTSTYRYHRPGSRCWHGASRRGRGVPRRRRTCSHWLPRRSVPRCPVRDDPPRPDRCACLCRRCVRRRRRVDSPIIWTAGTSANSTSRSGPPGCGGCADSARVRPGHASSTSTSPRWPSTPREVRRLYMPGWADR